MAKPSKLSPTHVQFKSGDKGKGYAALRSGTTWTEAKETARSFPEGSDAKPVRRK